MVIIPKNYSNWPPSPAVRIDGVAVLLSASITIGTIDRRLNVSLFEKVAEILFSEIVFLLCCIRLAENM